MVSNFLFSIFPFKNCKIPILTAKNFRPLQKLCSLHRFTADGIPLFHISRWTTSEIQHIISLHRMRNFGNFYSNHPQLAILSGWQYPADNRSCPKLAVCHLTTVCKWVRSTTFVLRSSLPKIIERYHHCCLLYATSCLFGSALCQSDVQEDTKTKRGRYLQLFFMRTVSKNISKICFLQNSSK